MAADDGTRRGARATGWLLVAIGVGWAALVVWSQHAGGAWGVVASISLYGAFALAVVWRIVRAVVRKDPAPVRRVVGPGVQGLGEVQDIYLGRRAVPPPVYAAPDRPDDMVAEAVVDRRDPLDDHVWVVGPDGRWATGGISGGTAG